MKVIKDIVRTEDGYYLHPEYFDFGDNDYISQEEFDAWVEKENIEVFTVALESEDSRINERYFEEGDPCLAEWEPTPPEGEGWFVASIWENEDGAFYQWFRNKE